MNEEQVKRVVVGEVKVAFKQLETHLRKVIMSELNSPNMVNLIKKVSTDVVNEAVGSLSKDMSSDLNNKIDEKITNLRETISEDINEKVDKQSTALTISKNQLATIDKNINKKLYDVMTKVIDPKLKSMESELAYHTQDSSEIITSYRKQVFGNTPNGKQKLLTHGKNNKPSGTDFLFFSDT